MTARDDLERRIADHYAPEGLSRAPDFVLRSVLESVETTPQRRFGAVRRIVPMNGNAFRLAAAAVAGILVISVAAFFFLGRSSPGIGGPGVTPTPTPMPFPTGTSGFSVAAGTYALELPASDATTGGDVPLRVLFSIPDGWQKNVTPTTLWRSDAAAAPGMRFGFHVVTNSVADPCDAGAGLLVPTLGPTVEDLSAALQAMPNVTVGSSRETSIDGHPAIALDDVALDDACTDEYHNLWWTPLGTDAVMAMAPGEVGQILIVDAAGARLAIVTITDAAATAAQRGELQGVIDSVRIEAPASAVPSP